MTKRYPPGDHNENPEWTDADFVRASSASEVLPAVAVTALVRRPGRPAGTLTSDRQQVTPRLPRAVIEHFKAGGPGGQTRAVAVLEREAQGNR